MPGIAALFIFAVNAVMFIGLPVLAFVVAKRAWGKKTSTSAIGAIVSVLLVCPFVLPMMSYAYRDHLCGAAGGWTFNLPENAALMRSADQGAQIDFSKYQLRFASERRGLWVRESKLQIENRQSGALFALRTEFFSDFLGGYARALTPNMSLDTDTQHQKAASRQMLRAGRLRR